MAELLHRLQDLEQIFEASDLEDASAHELFSEYEYLAGLYTSLGWNFAHAAQKEYIESVD